MRPQPGPQEVFGACPADIAIMGGSVFGGKTWSLVVEPLRHVHLDGFTFVAFRREMPEITNPGGMWDESRKWYPEFDGTAKEHTREWAFPSGAWGKFAGLQYESDVEGWKGAQVALFLFDQLELFTAHQFWYMLSRNRSACGIRPYIRATCNPIPEEDATGGWLPKLIHWWLGEDGFALPERSGVIRWFLRDGDEMRWAETVCPPERYHDFDRLEAEAMAELDKESPGEGKHARSLTFILARLQDNVIGNTLDPKYESNVRAMAMVERERLLGGDRGGNWKIRPTAGKVFNRAWFPIERAVPHDCIWLRYWDKAGTDAKLSKSKNGPAETAGVKMGYSPKRKQFFITDVEHGAWGSLQRNQIMAQKAAADGYDCAIVVEQEPGSGGKESAENTVRELAGYNVRLDVPHDDKIERAMGMSAQAEAGNVVVIEADWNEAFLNQAHRFAPGRGLKDMVDAAVGAFNQLTRSHTQYVQINPILLEGLERENPFLIA